MTISTDAIFIQKRQKYNLVLESFINQLEIKVLGQGANQNTHHLKELILPAFLLIYGLADCNLVLRHKKKLLTFRTGSLYLFEPFEPLTLIEEEACSGPYLYVYFSLDSISDQNIFKRFAYADGDQVFQHCSQKKLGAAMEKICQASLRDEPDSNFLLRYALRGLIAYIMFTKLHYHPQLNISSPQEANLIDLTFAYAKQHLKEPINIKKLASTIGVSCRQLDRIFKKALQEPPSRAITRFKLKQAIQMLKAGISVKETARSLGYASPSHFSSVFKAVLGTSPT